MSYLWKEGLTKYHDIHTNTLRIKYLLAYNIHDTAFEESFLS